MKDLQDKKILVVGHGNADMARLHLSERGVKIGVIVVDEKDSPILKKPDPIEIKRIERDYRYIPTKPKQDSWKRPYKYHK